MNNNEIPDNIKTLSIAQLKGLCDTLRERIIDTVTKNGGHLSSNLGVVELTVALHYVFNFPKDKIVFDVGHQCYAHKLLSGRADRFDSIRLKGGLSGFPKREESEYDSYNTGHAGTSVSAALGIAKARDLQGEDYSVIALIGDGSFNNGLVYEAFNSLRPLNTNILVILNDNGMSISPTVGSIHEYLEVLSNDSLHKQKLEKHANIFEKFGFSYDGVYDGNDLEKMIEKLAEVREKLKTQSVILHVVTKKGKGYSFCEENPQETHGVASSSSKPTSEYSKVLGRTLCDLAAKDERIVAVTAAMTPSLGLSEFFEKFPDRAIDVGICEEHATILSAALATQGMRPYYAVYSTFLQRSYDEIIVDICSQNLPVTMCIDRSGISGADGETHQGVFDLSYLSCIPNLTIATPKDCGEFKRMLEMSVDFGRPLVIRYPKDCRNCYHTDNGKIVAGTWEVLKQGGADVAILACGERAITLAFKAAAESGTDATVINARFIKPLDADMLRNLPQRNIVTIEDNMLTGGFGSQVIAFFADNAQKRVKAFGYADEFIPHGSVSELMEECGLSCREIASYLKLCE